MALLVELPSALIMPFTIVVAMTTSADTRSRSRWYPLYPQRGSSGAGRYETQSWYTTAALNRDEISIITRLRITAGQWDEKWSMFVKRVNYFARRH